MHDLNHINKARDNPVSLLLLSFTFVILFFKNRQANHCSANGVTLERRPRYGYRGNRAEGSGQNARTDALGLSERGLGVGENHSDWRMNYNRNIFVSAMCC